MKFIACGDIALCKRIEKMIDNKRAHEIAKDFRDYLKKADLFIANVECPLTDSLTPEWDYIPTMKASRKVAFILGELGVDAASLANNHIADYGKKGLEDTITVLEEQGILWCGAGFSPADAGKPLIIRKKNMAIGILALAQPEISAAHNGKWGAGVLEHDTAVKAMAELTKQVDIAIAYLHFGVEFVSHPTPDQVMLSRSLIDAGALLVIGHHPHVVQGYEYYKKGFIAYSLGNFIFDMIPGTDNFSRMGLLIEADICEKEGLKQVNLIPVDIYDGNPRSFNNTEREQAFHYLEVLSSMLANDEVLVANYYFTCRENLQTHISAMFTYLIKKRKFRRFRSLVLSQFWPQLLKLRVDLIRFLLTGDALRFEKNKNRHPQKVVTILWQLFCAAFWIVGLSWLKKPFKKME